MSQPKKRGDTWYLDGRPLQVGSKLRMGVQPKRSQTTVFGVDRIIWEDITVDADTLASHDFGGLLRHRFRWAD